MGNFRHQFDEFFQRFGCPHLGFHLDPVTQQHDQDQGCQFEIKVRSFYEEGREAAVDIGRNDRQGNQHHHTERPVLPFLPSALQKRFAAVEENDGG